MALSLSDILLVKRKVFNFLKSGTNGDPAAYAEFAKLFEYLAQHGSNPDLQVNFFADLTADVVVADAACKVYGVYIVKGATGTDAFYNIFDDATNDATAGDARLSLPMVTSGDKQVWIAPRGIALAAGLVHGSYTALIGSNGSTPSTSGDGPARGFVIYGNP